MIKWGRSGIFRSMLCARESSCQAVCFSQILVREASTVLHTPSVRVFYFYSISYIVFEPHSSWNKTFFRRSSFCISLLRRTTLRYLFLIRIESTICQRKGEYCCNCTLPRWKKLSKLRTWIEIFFANIALFVNKLKITTFTPKWREIYYLPESVHYGALSSLMMFLWLP